MTAVSGAEKYGITGHYGDPHQPRIRRQWPGPLADHRPAGLGLITFAIDASNTRLVLPQMMTSLRVELYQSHWVFTAPGIARTVMTASTGWLSGWLGPRPLYLLSIGSLTLGALGSLLAWDWPSLLVFRVLAGVGGMIPLSQAIFYQIFPPGQRGMALGFPSWAGPSGQPCSR